jgi:hypothetical protein
MSSGCPQASFSSLEAKADWMSANPIIAEFAPLVAACATAPLRLSPYVLADGSVTELGVVLICGDDHGQDREVVRYLIEPPDKEHFAEWITQAQAWLAQELQTLTT